MIESIAFQRKSAYQVKVSKGIWSMTEMSLSKDYTMVASFWDDDPVQRFSDGVSICIVHRNIIFNVGYGFTLDMIITMFWPLMQWQQQSLNFSI